jgi:hypothetical protein
MSTNIVEYDCSVIMQTSHNCKILGKKKRATFEAPFPLINLNY